MVNALSECWDAALDADERALAAAERARTLAPTDLVPLRAHLRADRH